MDYLKVDYATFKKFHLETGIEINELSSSGIYDLYLVKEGGFGINTTLQQGSDDFNDYEANLKKSSYSKTNTSDGKLIVVNSPFASKKLPEGSLFKRVHGVSETILANSTGNIDLVVSYDNAKFNGAEIINCSIGDSVNFKVLDTPAGTISTIPNYMLNQFGFNVAMPNSYYKNTSEYDANLIGIDGGMTVRCEYTNNSNEDRTIYLNIELHEVKP